MDTKYFKKLNRHVPSLGMGTWKIGGDMERDERYDEAWVSSLKKGLEIGLTLIDTAEIYGAGHAEELVGEAIRGFPREDIFIVSKVWPIHAGRENLLKAAESSCRRLGTYIDLYLLHWPTSDIHVSETMRSMERLVDRGLIRYIGVSNFEVDQIDEARSHLSKVDLVAVQNEYSLINRRYERDVLPYIEREGMMFMAYTPLGMGVLARDNSLARIGLKYGKTAAQVALNWLICVEAVVPIPKAALIEHIEEDAGAMGWRLGRVDWEAISSIFTPQV
ncbi:MAG: aldo/keto reductase [Candidatus Methylarchaceae archaeon HK02M1]|nr:aldo/keto reductase [Candidatus Methylarchaceae archaeon HK02M1]